ncbi:Hypothetical predicted protein [Olea europaea subsp. europaea]|uniref:Transmembrane protein n=1 Tax=Olea europaea subsp. europaea TaxID=158383 RepID=A0A8S0UA30_OLEEU|nr:Hypothetical predicted protein [Olea europaea subsp. europaea]
MEVGGVAPARAAGKEAVEHQCSVANRCYGERYCSICVCVGVVCVRLQWREVRWLLLLDTVHPVAAWWIVMVFLDLFCGGVVKIWDLLQRRNRR